ncbi:MAG: type III-A CRISPR-associated RAMP protein Csm4 [Desulfobacterota bacterium]|nr:type III-A CRISPR-associated RAMP protein Csm4 [Thermodesulfobacteriota bacterium]
MIIATGSKQERQKRKKRNSQGFLINNGDHMIYIYHIRPLSSFHIGFEGIGQERLDESFRSDALFGALLQCWQVLYDDNLEDIITEGPFSISSCFPVVKGQRFYPVPIGSLDRILKQVKGSDFKKWKKIRYISEPIFQKILNGNLTLCCMPEGKFLVEQPVQDISYASDLETPRIAIDPLTGTVMEGAFFYCINRFFAQDSGLFFLARFKNAETMEKFEASLRLLGDTGIGGDRSIGRGAFVFSRHDFILNLPNEADCWVTLSLYHPTQEEVTNGILQVSLYNFVKRHGFVTGIGARALRRQSVFMLEEGSVFFKKLSPVGDNPIVLRKGNGNCPFNVFRYGKAFCLPMKGGCFEYDT